MTTNSTPSKKGTVAQTRRRVTAVYRLLIQGADRESILAYADKEGWNVSESMIKQYTMRATQMIIADTNVERAESLATARARLRLILSKTLSLQDFKTALNVQKEINALEGLHAPAKLNIRIEYVSQIQEIEALAAQHGLSAGDLFNELISTIRENSVLPNAGEKDAGA